MLVGKYVCGKACLSAAKSNSTSISLLVDLIIDETVLNVMATKGFVPAQPPVYAATVAQRPPDQQSGGRCLCDEEAHKMRASNIYDVRC